MATGILMDTQIGHDHLTHMKGTWPTAAPVEERKLFIS